MVVSLWLEVALKKICLNHQSRVQPLLANAPALTFRMEYLEKSVLLTTALCFCFGALLRRQLYEFLPTRFPTKVIGLSIAICMDGSRLIHGHAANGVFGNDLGGFHDIILVVMVEVDALPAAGMGP
jgi:hypothetical protein